MLSGGERDTKLRREVQGGTLRVRSGYSSHQVNREKKGTKVIKDNEGSLHCLEKSQSPWPKSSGIKLSPK